MTWEIQPAPHLTAISHSVESDVDLARWSTIILRYSFRRPPAASFAFAPGLAWASTVRWSKAESPSWAAGHDEVPTAAAWFPRRSTTLAADKSRHYPRVLPVVGCWTLIPAFMSSSSARFGRRGRRRASRAATSMHGNSI